MLAPMMPSPMNPTLIFGSPHFPLSFTSSYGAEKKA